VGKSVAIAKSESTVLNDIIVDGIQDKKGLDIISLDLTNISESVTDHYIICHGDSTIQVKAIAASVRDKVKKDIGEVPLHIEGEKNAEWMLLDYVNIVVHIFLRDRRSFYMLEDLWNDAPTTKYPNL
jgi:ribosome-associated protein